MRKNRSSAERLSVATAVSGFGVVGLLAGAMLPASAQTTKQTNRGSAPADLIIVSAPAPSPATREVVREIDDPATGNRWLLKRDSQNPGGPGRMVLLASEHSQLTSARVRIEAENIETGRSSAMIHAGDSLIVEEHTTLVDAFLEAISLAPAAQGGVFRVRLSLGGREVNARAIAPGRALLSPCPGATR
jgi:hypothetical protein